MKEGRKGGRKMDHTDLKKGGRKERKEERK